MKKAIFIFYVLAAFLINAAVAQTVIEKEKDDKVYLWIEAEDGTIDEPMMVHDTEAASGGQFIEVRSGNNNTEYAPEDGRAVYTFSVKNAGTYKIWGRVRIDMSDEDAFWVRMDDDDWVKWKGIEVGCKWHWDEVHDHLKNDQVMEYNLTAGPHTLMITYCMDQTRLDKILITNDLDYIPVDRGPNVSAVIEAGAQKLNVGEAVLFDGSSSASTEGKVISYAWDVDGERIGDGPSINHAFATTGQHTVKLVVKDNVGLTGTASKTVAVYSNEPVVDFHFSPDHSKAGQSITFDGSNSFDPDGKIVDYKWDFGDGAYADEPVVKHAYSKAGDYPVTLTVIDNEGNQKSTTRLISVITCVPKKIIFETDMCLDVDDVGALAMLHALADNGEVELLAVCFNEVHPSGAAAIDAINTWYGRGDIPVGIYKKELADPDKSDYLDSLAKFPHDLDQSTAKDAVEVYTHVLKKQEDHSVTIVSVGFLNNLYELLKAEPDLVAQKVCKLVVMGGIHNDGFNLSRHNLVSASEYVIRHWPSPLIISQAGSQILTGEHLEETPVDNPVREAYYQFFNSNFCNRPSWDQVAVLYGVRGLLDYFAPKTSGYGILPNGYKWQMDDQRRFYLETKQPNEFYRRLIENLMTAPPQR